MLIQQTKSAHTTFFNIMTKKVNQLFQGKSRSNEDSKLTRSSQKQLVITTIEGKGKIPVTIIRSDRALNSSALEDFIATAQDVYQAGGRHIVLDMSQVPVVGSSGMVALHSMALITRGDEPFDLAGGWDTYRAVANDLTTGRQDHFKLLNPQPKVKQCLERLGITEFLEIHADLETAIASF